jgi:hypothetical protein
MDPRAGLETFRENTNCEMSLKLSNFFNKKEAFNYGSRKFLRY